MAPSDLPIVTCFWQVRAAATVGRAPTQLLLHAVSCKCLRGASRLSGRRHLKFYTVIWHPWGVSTASNLITGFILSSDESLFFVRWCDCVLPSPWIVFSEDRRRRSNRKIPLRTCPVNCNQSMKLIFLHTVVLIGGSTPIVVSRGVWSIHIWLFLSGTCRIAEKQWRHPW